MSVTETAPVDGAFVWSKLLWSAAARVKAHASDPAIMPVDAETERINPGPRGTLHMSELSDVHCVCPDTVPLTRPTALGSRAPKRLLPSSVTLTPPVAAAFDAVVLLIESTAPPNEKAALQDPTEKLAEIAATPPRVTTAGCLHITALCDTHALAAPIVRPARPDPLYEEGPAPATPMFDPISVTLTAPVDGVVVATAPLAVIPDRVKDADRLPKSNETVAERERRAPTPSATLHLTALLDVHIVPSTSVPPMRPRPLSATSPCVEDPSSVTLTAPVTGPLAARTLLGLESKEKVTAVAALPCIISAVIAAVRTPLLMPIAYFEVTALMESHCVASL
jgi:hypothetical protein